MKNGAGEENPLQPRLGEESFEIEKEKAVDLATSRGCKVCWYMNHNVEIDIKCMCGIDGETSQ